jgi:hypothetical protein
LVGGVPPESSKEAFTAASSSARRRWRAVGLRSCHL